MKTDPDRFKVLPRPIKLEEMIAQVDARVVADPERGHNTDTDFLLRYCIM